MPKNDPEQGNLGPIYSHSMAPSSEPFYSNIPAAPLSPMAYPQPPVSSEEQAHPNTAATTGSNGPSYPEAPPVAASGFQGETSTDPYSGIGHSQPAPPPASSATATAAGSNNYAHAPLSGATYTPPTSTSVADLYRAPGNPYSDRSGRAIQEVPDLAPPESPRANYVSPEYEYYSQPGAATAGSGATTPGSGAATAGAAATAGNRRPTQTSQAYAPARTTQSTTSLTYSRQSSGFSRVFRVIIFILIALVISQAGRAMLNRFIESDLFSSSDPAVEVTALTPGTCFASLDYVNGDQLQPIDCSNPHQFEISTIINVPGDEYPGYDALMELGGTECMDAADELLMENSLGPNDPLLYYHLLYPSDNSWSSGDREIICFIASGGADELVGSAVAGELEVR